MIETVKLTHRTEGGSLVRSEAIIEYKDDRIFFRKSPFALKDEIKAMKGSKWHGYDDPPQKIWSVADCQRNRFQLDWLKGEDVYEWFDRDVTEFEPRRKELMPHQGVMLNTGLTYHYQIWAAIMGLGKTLSAQELIEQSGVKFWWWVGPKTSLPNIQREFIKWGWDNPAEIEWLTYDRLVKYVDDFEPGDPLPQGVIFDESSRLKGATSQRTTAAMMLTDMIRKRFARDGFVIEMSGTPAPKSPVDWWAPTEVAWPGFLKEGTPQALEKRLAFMVDKQFDAGVFKKRSGWKDDERKCAKCGDFEDAECHQFGEDGYSDDYHKWEPSVNEVTLLYERLKGLVTVLQSKECLGLPEKRYRQIHCKPTAQMLRVAKALADSAPNTMTGMSWLRELSSGFQYREVKDGVIPCPHCPKACGEVEEWFDPRDEDRTFSSVDMLNADLVARLEKRTVPCPKCHGNKQIDRLVRVSKEVPCPKEPALKGLLAECDETGRIVLFGAFQGSIDRMITVCRKEGWDIVRCDGRGYEVKTASGEIVTDVHGLDYWANRDNSKVAFVANHESGGMSLTLVESRMAVFWDNPFKPEFRIQAEDRIHRKGMDVNFGCTIVDLFHLPTDARVLSVLQENRRIELMTLGQMTACLDDAESSEACEIVELT
jgi:hypothetical protein